MNKDFERFLSLPDQEREDVFVKTAGRLSTAPRNIEKDFWVCYVLDALYNRLPGSHPRLVFKGGTSLSKAFDLIQRFSEDVDIVVDRDVLGFTADRDPTSLEGLSNTKRAALFKELQAACGEYINGPLAKALASVFGESCRILPDEKDDTRQTLLIEYPTLYPGQNDPYVLPSVKLEAGARSALGPSTTASIAPYLADDLPDGWSLEVGNLHVFKPERTYLDKLMILHGLHCGHRDQGRLPAGGGRASRHYYDVAVITGTEVGAGALADDALLDDVRGHNLIAFPSAWRKVKEAVRGTIRLVPQGDLRAALERDYQAMRGMMFGAPPDFGWVVERIAAAEDAVNRR